MPKSPDRSAANALEQVYAADRAAWREWLASNHAASAGIWLVFDKKSSRAERLLYGDAVEEALCFGWIDSTVRALDETRYLQLFTPRKPKSTWSRPNKERVERLIAEGLMAAAGLAAIELAMANGAWTSLDAVDAMIVPDDLAEALARTGDAAANFAAFSPSARKGYLHWISQAVRPETRALRIAKVVELSAANVRTRQLSAPRTDGASVKPAPHTPPKGRATKQASPKGAAPKRTSAKDAATKRTATNAAKGKARAKSSRPAKRHRS